MSTGSKATGRSMAPSSRLTVSCPNGVQFPNSVTISRKVKVVVATALATSAVLTLDGASAPGTAAMSILRPVPRKAAVIRTVPAAHAVERPARAASRDAFLWWPAAGHAGCRSHAAVGPNRARLAPARAALRRGKIERSRHRCQDRQATKRPSDRTSNRFAGPPARATVPRG